MRSDHLGHATRTKPNDYLFENLFDLPLCEDLRLRDWSRVYRSFFFMRLRRVQSWPKGGLYVAQLHGRSDCRHRN